MNLGELDHTDKTIIDLLQHNPFITFEHLAKEVDLSIPEIRKKIYALISRGTLHLQYGIDFQQENDLVLVLVRMKTNRPDLLNSLVKENPCFINILKVAGDYDFLVIIANFTLHAIDELVDVYFRESEEFWEVKMDIVTDYAQPFILPVRFSLDPDQLLSLDSDHLIE